MNIKVIDGTGRQTHEIDGFRIEITNDGLGFRFFASSAPNDPRVQVWTSGPGWTTVEADGHPLVSPANGVCAVYVGNRRPDPGAQPALCHTPPVSWTRPLRPVGPEHDPGQRLIGTVEILGVEHAVNAEEVVERDGQQVGRDDDQATFVPEIQQIAGGRARAVTVGGRRYLLLVTPYSD